MKQYLIEQNLSRFCSISVYKKRRYAMGKILLAILGVAAVIVEQVFDDE